jgi:PPM family protein phosphatase
METRKKQPLICKSAALTNIGMVRSNNEDCLFALDGETNTFGAKSFGIYLIADGMGGHQSGEVASNIACRTISRFLMDKLIHVSSKPSPELLVKCSIESANRQIFRLASSSKEHNSMGTTITLGFKLDNKLYLGHAGDSRAYLIREGKMKQLTEDHSLMAYLMSKGAITSDEARNHPDRGQIFRFLGASEKINIYSTSLTLLADDILVFCSDGLTSSVSDYEIIKRVRDSKDVNEACENLVDLANFHGGEDNISVVVVNCLPIEKVSKGC